MDKELLFRPRLPEADVDIPGIGAIRVRGLNRAEAMAVEGTKGNEARERKIVAFGMVDPVLTESEVGRWQKASTAGELESVAMKVAELSGMLPAAAREVYLEMEADSGAEFPVLPGAEAADDGGPDAGGNE